MHVSFQAPSFSIRSKTNACTIHISFYFETLKAAPSQNRQSKQNFLKNHKTYFNNSTLFPPCKQITTKKDSNDNKKTVVLQKIKKYIY